MSETPKREKKPLNPKRVAQTIESVSDAVLDGMGTDDLLDLRDRVLPKLSDRIHAAVEARIASFRRAS